MMFQNRILAAAVMAMAVALVVLVGAKAEPEQVGAQAQAGDGAVPSRSEAVGAVAVSAGAEAVEESAVIAQTMTPAREPRKAILRVGAAPRFGPVMRLDLLAPRLLQGRRALVTTSRLERVCVTRPQSPVPSCFWVRSGQSNLRSVIIRDFQTLRVIAPIRRQQRTLVTIGMRSIGPPWRRIEVMPVRAITRGRSVIIMPPAARLR